VQGRGEYFDEFLDSVDDPIMFVSLFGETDFYFVSGVKPSFPRAVERVRLVRGVLLLQVPQCYVGSCYP
jgi:hypothetical protein